MSECSHNSHLPIHYTTLKTTDVDPFLESLEGEDNTTLETAQKILTRLIVFLILLNLALSAFVYLCPAPSVN